MVELGRVDIITEVSTLASHMAMPREGHLDALFDVFCYLKRKHNSRLVFDPTYPDIDSSVFDQMTGSIFMEMLLKPFPQMLQSQEARILGCLWILTMLETS